jgi:hypothetical protein
LSPCLFTSSFSCVINHHQRFGDAKTDSSVHILKADVTKRRCNSVTQIGLSNNSPSRPVSSAHSSCWTSGGKHTDLLPFVLDHSASAAHPSDYHGPLLQHKGNLQGLEECDVSSVPSPIFSMKWETNSFHP